MALVWSIGQLFVAVNIYFIDQMTHSHFLCVCGIVVMMMQLQVNELGSILKP